MGKDTAIEWTTHTASPWHGCSKIAAGCDNCYAARQAVRNPGTLGIWGDDGTRVKSKSFIDNLRAWNKSAAERGVVESVFPSICDPFEDRPELDPWRREMFAVADECPNIRLLLLTKRPQNIRRMWPVCSHCEGKSVRPTLGRCKVCDGHGQSPQRKNCWLGCSIAEQKDADANIPELLKCRDLAPVLFLSAEPLIGPVNLERSIPCGYYCDEHVGHVDHGPNGRLGHIGWVIIGGESGPSARPCNPEWIRSLVSQCKAASVPCFVKQLGSNVVTRNDMVEDQFNSLDNGWPDPHVEHDIHGFQENYQGADCRVRLRDKKGGDWEEWPADLRVRQFPDTER